ncbi:MAG: SDR family oxidoreductase [Steroidobacteraceae bacterium]
MNHVFSGKAGIVTGASSGIGRTIAQTLGAAGMELWLIGRSATELRATANAIADSGGPQAHCVALDLSRSGALAQLVTEVGQQHPYLFCLINNAGVMYPEPIIDADPARWHAMFAINLITPMEGCRAAVQQMRKHRKPAHLVNISSLAGREYRYGAYGVAKAALTHMGRTLRNELEKDDIRVATIIPGGFATNLARGFDADSLEKLQIVSGKLNIDMTGPDAAKVIGDPAHIANIIKHLLELPIDINFEEITVRPAIEISL